MPFQQSPQDSNGKDGRSQSLSESNGKGVPKLSEERIEAAKKGAKRLYLILLVVGLAIGALVSIGVVAGLKRFGLTDVPNQVEDVPNQVEQD
ncbi:MAG: hypothetical protein VKK04_20515 [Synechococcales bacterium]|nr:hypothetical protein [Synechococcales bacterium]